MADLRTRLGHLWLALTVLPGLVMNGRHRALLREMFAFSRCLPAHLQTPLPTALRALTPNRGTPSGNVSGRSLSAVSEADLRRLADLAALLDRRSPLGLCLRRSLLRYHFLSRAGIPLTVQFGAKFVTEVDQRQITGHAWVEQNGRPYYETDDNWRDFTVMLRWPEKGKDEL